LRQAILQHEYSTDSSYKALYCGENKLSADI
jgi:hypothetical protein